MPTLDTQVIRAQFPALTQELDRQPVVFLDNPGGTQVPQAVIDALSAYLRRDNANRGGPFVTSQRSDALLDEAHAALADLLGAASPDEIVFGANMTTLTFGLSRAIGHTLGPGDEIIVTRLDHDANITPWVLMAEDRGVTVRHADFHPEDCTLDMHSLRDLLNERTRLVCVGLASNATGTVNDVATITRWAHDAGAQVFVDAVHYVPHGPVDVQALDCDFLACSVYKFYGPHVGVLYGRYELLDRLRAYKVRPAHDEPPGKFETGTQNHEGIAGALAAVDYLAGLGAFAGSRATDAAGLQPSRRQRLRAALSMIRDYDRQLTVALLGELEGIPQLTIHGITDPQHLDWRVPTVSFTIDGQHPAAIAAALGQAGIFVWHGNYYAVAVTERLGLEDKGGMVRVGAVHYNTPGEIRRFGETLRRWLAAQA
jgi:cysteine desulfurase family protein (TIGR01976 family)